MKPIATLVSMTVTAAATVTLAALPASAAPPGTDGTPVPAASSHTEPLASHSGGSCESSKTVFVDQSDPHGWTFAVGAGGGSYEFTPQGLKLTVAGGEKAYGYVSHTMTKDTWCQPRMSVTGDAASSVGVNLFPAAPTSSTDPAAIVSMPSFEGNWMSANGYRVGVQGTPPWGDPKSYAPLSRYFSKNPDLTLAVAGFSLGTAPAGSSANVAYLTSITIGDTTYQFADLPVTAQEPTFSDAQCGLDGVVTIPQQDNVTYWVDGEQVTGKVEIPAGTGVYITAKAADHYTLTNPLPWHFTATTPQGCPAILPPCAPTRTVTVSPTQLNGWSLATEKSGSYAFGSDGLTISAEGGGKVQGTVTLPQPLTKQSVADKKACEPSIDFTTTQPSGHTLQLGTILLPNADPGAGSGAVTHEEPGVYDAPGYRRWWSNEDYGVASGRGYQSLDTLGNYLEADNSFEVGGFALGRLSSTRTHTEVLIKSMTFGDTKYVFTADTPVTPKAPVFNDSSTANGDTVTIPTMTGVTYVNAASGATVSGVVKVADKATLTVKAQAVPGYTVEGTTTWTFTGTAPATAAGGTGGGEHRNLPWTGAEGIGTMLLLVVVALAAGTGLVFLRRRRPTTR